MTTDDLDLTVPATASGMVGALERIETYCAALNFGAELVSRVRIIVEELFSNTVKYGYRGECDRPIRIGLRDGNVLTLTYEDDAPLFDPTRWTLGDEAMIAPDERPEGKAGIMMILGLSESAIYKAKPIGNRLILTLSRRGAG